MKNQLPKTDAQHLTKNLMFKVLLLLAMVGGAGRAWGQVSETFSNATNWPSQASYGSYSSGVGASGGQWTGVAIIVAPTGTSNGTGSTGLIQMQSVNGILTTPNIASGGVGTVTIQARVSGSSGGFSIEKNVNNAGWVSVQAFTSSSTAGVQFQATVNDASANIKIRINNTGGGSGRTLYVHDFVTTTYSGCSAPTLTPSQTNLTCNGVSTGVASVSASGVAPYTYSWNNGTTSNSISSLAAGTYTVTVTDASPCSATQTYVITQPTAIAPTPASNTPCVGATLNLTSTPTGGTSPYTTYSWSGPSFSSSTQNPSIVGVTAGAAGTYTVTVTDNASCTKSATVAVVVNSTANNVTGQTATLGNTQVSVAWTGAPSGCYDEIIIVAHTATISGTPTGTYTASSLSYTDGSNPAFPGGGKVVYNGSGAAATKIVTSLTNGTPYFFKLFTRTGSNWSSGVQVTATPQVPSTNTDHFRSFQTGTWGTASTWESSSDSINWVPATLAPDDNSASIVIQSHTVTVGASVTANQLTVKSGGTLTVSTGVLTISNGNGTDLLMAGILNNSSGVTFQGATQETISGTWNNAAALTFNASVSTTVSISGTFNQNSGGSIVQNTTNPNFTSTGVFNLVRSGGTIPLATWDVASLCNVTGVTSAVPTNMGQTFGKFTWNCSGQSTFIVVGTTAFNPKGLFTVSNTGSSGNPYLEFESGGSGGTYNLDGGLTVNGGTFINNFNGSGATNEVTVNITGDLTVSGSGTYSLGSGSGAATPSNYMSTVNLTGNLSITSSVAFAMYTPASNNFGRINFTGSGVQQFTRTTASGNKSVDFYIPTGKSLLLNNDLQLRSSSSSDYDQIVIDGTLNTGTNAVVTLSGTQTRCFVDSACTIITANTSGISTALGAVIRTIHAKANYIFNGATQATGFPSDPMSIANLTISSSATVTLGQAITSSGNVSITSGTFANTNNKDISLTGNWTNSGTYTKGTETITFNGNGTAQTLSGTNSFKNLTINHTGANAVSASGSLTVTGLMRVQSGSFTSATQYTDVQIDPAGTLALAGDISVSGNWTNNGIFTHNNYGVTFNGSAGDQTISGATNFYNLTANNTGGFSVNKVIATSATLTVSGLLHVVSGEFNFNDAQFNDVTIEPGSYFISGVSNFYVAGNWNKIGNGTFNGNGYPIFNKASGTQTFDNGGYQLSYVTHDGAGTLQIINHDFNVNSGFANLSGTFDLNGRTMYLATQWINNGTASIGNGNVEVYISTTISGTTVTQFNNISIYNTVTVTLQQDINVTGNWVNNGTFTHNSHAVTFNGTTVMSGASTNSFNTVSVPGSLTTGSATMNVAGLLSNTGTISNQGTITSVNGCSNAGIYKGTGAFTGNLFFNGASGNVSPGNSPGCLSFGNDFNTSGTTTIEINGTATACTDYDKITVTGTATLGGTLNVSVGYSPVAGDAITFIDATTLSGTFATVNAPANWTVYYDNPSTGKVTIKYCLMPSLSTSQTNISCVPNNPTGSATVTASGGSSPYTYLWNDASSQTTATATGLTAGVYTVTVTATGGCATSTSVTITANTTPPTVGITETDNSGAANNDNILCNGGSATLTATGTSVSYTWAPNDRSLNSTNSSPVTATPTTNTIYTLTGTGANGCVNTATVSITVNALPTASCSSTNNTNIVANGTATVTAGGGNGSYTYLWSSNAASQTTPTATGLAGGTYTVTVTSGGCVSTCSSVVVNQGNYAITTTGNAIVITDLSGNGDLLAASQNGTNIRFVVTPTTRTYTLNGGAITAFTTPADAALAGVTDITINQGAGNDTLNVAAFSATLPNTTINGGTGNDTVIFNGNINFATNANLDVNMQNDDPTPGVDNVSFANSVQVALSGTGSATIKVSKKVTLINFAILSTVDGNLTIEANQQVTPTTGGFSGVFLAAHAEVKSTGTGVVTIKGKGGNFNNGSSGSQWGVEMAVGSKITGGTTGTTVVQGTGGSSTGGNNYGVYLLNTGTQITSNGSSVSVTGVGGGTSVNGSNYGVSLENSTSITAGGSGNVTVNGTGGGGTGANNFGVNVSNSSTITSSGGNVSITGTGGGTGSSLGNYGVALQTSGTITAGGSGTVTIIGNGSPTATGADIGVSMGSTCNITSSGGNVSVTGYGGNASAVAQGVSISGGSIITAGGNGTVSVTGTGSATAGGLGVSIQTPGTIKADGSGTVTVQGTGGTASSINSNNGVYLNGATAVITSSGGNVSVTGQGGGAGTSSNNYGIGLVNGGTITAGLSGTVTINGTGGSGSGGSNNGLYLNSSAGTSTITSNGGSVNVTGLGGGTGSTNYGIYLQSSSIITAGGSGSVTVLGTGSSIATGISNYGVNVLATSQITSSGGNVSVTGNGGGTGVSSTNIGVNNSGGIYAGANGTVTVNGTGGTGSGGSNSGVSLSGIAAYITSGGAAVSVTGLGGNTGATNYGVSVSSNATITSGGIGTLTVLGTGGASTGDNNLGVNVSGTNSIITSGGGNVHVIGLGGGSGSSLGNYGVALQTSGTISAGGNGTVTINGTGGATTGSNNYGINVNGANSAITSSGGNVSVTGTKGGGTATQDIYLNGGGVISSGGTGGDITLISTSGGTYPNTSGTDVTTTATKTLSFGAGSKLNIDIDGTTLDAQYQQLNVAGLVDLSNATLTFTGSTHTPVAAQTFTIVDNDGADAITGTFVGLAEGATITNFLGSSLNATITYVGGTGNDVVLTVVPPCVDPTVPTLAATVNPICNGGATTLSIQTGTLNSATDWQWYTGSCGGTSVGSGTSINVSPSVATTYYARGEGGCVTPGSCSSITVNVNPLPSCTISGATTVCYNSTGNSYSAPAGMTTYAWSITGNGTITSATNIQNITVSAGASGSFTVQVITTDGTGCSNTCNQVVNIQTGVYTGIYRTYASGFWNSPATWETWDGCHWVTPATPPSSADNAITIQSLHTVTVNTNVTADEVVVDGTLTLTSNTLTVANGTGTDITVNGNLNLSGGTIDGTGDVSITSGGTFTWNSGSLSGTLFTMQNGATGNISTASGHSISNTQSLVNNGTLNWNNGVVYMNATTNFTNNGNLNLLGDFSLTHNGGTPTFANGSTGVITKSVGSGTFNIGNTSAVTFNNSGQINLQSGYLNINANGTYASGGSINVSSGKAFAFIGGTQAFNSGFSFTSVGGPGIITFASTTTLVSGVNYDATLVTYLNGGTANWSKTGLVIDNMSIINSATFNNTGSVTVSNSFDFQNGSINGVGSVTVSNSGTFSTGSAKYITNGQSYTNNGTITWSAGNFFIADNGTLFTNNGILDMTADVILSHSTGGNPVFTNSATGIVKKSGGAGTTIFGNVPSVVFNNNGQLNVESGTITTATTGTYNSGSSINITAGKALAFTGGTETFNSGCSFTSVGAGGYITFAATSSLVTGVNYDATLLTYLNGGTANWSHSGLIINNLSLINNATFNNTGAVTVPTAFDFQNGSINGVGSVTVSNTGTFSTGSAKYITNGQNFTNNGTITWSAGNFFIADNGTLFTNNGILDMTSDVILSHSTGGNPVFTNSATGIVKKSGGAGTTIFGNVPSVVFNNNGQFNVESGTVITGSTLTNNFGGSINITSGKSLAFTGGSETFNSGCSLNSIGGPGYISFNATSSLVTGVTYDPTLITTLNGGTANWSHSALTINNLTLINPTLNNTGSVTVPTTFDWQGGSINNAGTVLISGTGTFSTGSGKYVTNGQSVTNNGSINWSGGNLFLADNGTSFTNNGTLDMTADVVLSHSTGGNPVFTNSATGIVVKSGGGGTSTFGNVTSVVFNNLGQFNVQTGTVAMNASGTRAGSFNVSTGATLTSGYAFAFTGTTFTNNGTVSDNISFNNSGTYKGSGLYNGSLFTNAAIGTVSPGNSPGCQTFSNGWTTSGATDIEINGTTACTQFDKITVTGTATLGGTLNVTVGYAANSGDQITFINATTLSGTFATVNVPANWYINYNYPAVGQVTFRYCVPATLGFTQTNISCSPNNPLGSATVIPTLGTAPYTYLWNDGGAQTTVTATGLAAGVYTVTVFANGGCSSSAAVTITGNLTAPTAGITNNTGTTVLSCSNPAISVTATGSGQGALSYAWSGGATPSTAANSFTVAGIYTVTVTDAFNGCVSTSSITITGSLPPATNEYVSQTNGSWQTPATWLWFDGCNWVTAGSAPNANSIITIQSGHTVTLDGTHTINSGKSCTVDGVLIANAALTNNGTLTVNGTLQLNAGGSVTGTAPVYGSASTLIYSSGGIYSRSAEWSATSGAGYPNNVTIQNGTTLNLAAGGSADRACAGNLTLGTAAGAGTLTMSAMTNKLTVNGNLNLGTNGGAGQLTLSTSAGGDFELAGNWNQTGGVGGFTDNNRRVYLIGNTTTNLGTNNNWGIIFANLSINKTGSAYVNVFPHYTTITVMQNLTLNSIIKTWPDHINIMWGGNVTRNSGWVNGVINMPYSIANPTWTFYIGDDNYYTPVTMTVNGIAGNGLFQGYTIPGNSGNIGTSTFNPVKTIARTWGISNYSGTSFSSSNITVNWDANDVMPGVNTNAVYAGIFNYGNGQWQYPTMGAKTPTSAQFTGGNVVGDFQVGESGCTVPSLSTSQTNISCVPNNPTGSATVTATGGSSPYMYLWNDGGAQTTATATGLTSGVYTVTVTANGGCTVSTSVTITGSTTPPVATVTPSSANLTCAVTSVNLIASGGAPYLWDDNSTSPNRTVLAAGTYTATVTGSFGCTASASSVITQVAPSVITVTGSVTNLLCKSGNTGAITTSVSGGFSPYTYLWNNGNTNANRTSLAAGIYVVTVTDANGCTKVASFTITQPSNGVVINVNKTNVRCGGSSTGSITLTPSGGAGPYTYLWNNGSTLSTQSNLIAGNYTVTVTDFVGCPTSKTITITQNPAIVVILSYGSGTATATASGGVPPYDYLWNTVPLQTNSTATGLTQNVNYKVKVTDSKNCTKLTFFTQPLGRLSAAQEFTFDVSIYPNPSDGMVTLNFNSSRSFHYSVKLFDALGKQLYISNNENADGNNSANFNFADMPKGIYMLQVQSEIGNKILRVILK